MRTLPKATSELSNNAKGKSIYIRRKRYEASGHKLARGPRPRAGRTAPRVGGGKRRKTTSGRQTRGGTSASGAPRIRVVQGQQTRVRGQTVGRAKTRGRTKPHRYVSKTTGPETKLLSLTRARGQPGQASECAQPC